MNKLFTCFALINVCLCTLDGEKEAMDEKRCIFYLPDSMEDMVGATCDAQPSTKSDGTQVGSDNGSVRQAEHGETSQNSYSADVRMDCNASNRRRMPFYSRNCGMRRRNYRNGLIAPGMAPPSGQFCPCHTFICPCCLRTQSHFHNGMDVPLPPPPGLVYNMYPIIMVRYNPIFMYNHPGAFNSMRNPPIYQQNTTYDQ